MSDEEVWKAIKGFEGSYEVSSMGRVRSLDRKSRAKLGSYQDRKGRLLKQKDTKGYYRVSLYSGGVPTYWLVHRLVAFVFIPKRVKRLEINHRNGDKKDNRVTNLEWVNDREQNDHALRIGLRGKITAADAVEIRRLYATGNYKQSELADIYGLKSSAGVSEIISGKRWKVPGYLPGPRKRVG